MNRYFWGFLLLVCFSAQISRTDGYCDDPQSEKFVSLKILQTLDLRAAFDAVYEIAQEQGTVDHLPIQFLNCYESLCSGSERVKCSDFILALKTVIDTLYALRKNDEKNGYEVRSATARPHCCCEERIRRLEEDLLEVFLDFSDRIEVLEKICAIRHD